MKLFLAIVLGVWAVSAQVHSAAPDPRALKTENVFLIMSDGLRWQEVFTGAEEALMNATNGGVKNPNLLRTNFWRATPELRRTTLLPFFWGEIARRGQLFGNQAKGSRATLTNTRKFSYPGYNEILTGANDPTIDSNDKKLNRNLTVFEWLGQKPKFKGEVVAFGTWDVFPYIFNRERSRIPIWPHFEPRFADKAIKPSGSLLKLMEDTVPVFDWGIQDSFLWHVAIEHVRQERPRLAFFGLGETDEWAHEGRYDLYLEAAHRFDRFVRNLWETVQSIPRYRDKTTFILSTDHGRGSGLTAWKDHGEKIEGAENIWVAVLGPDTPPLGERFETTPITLNQIAATLAAFVGEDYQAALPQVGGPISEVIRTLDVRRGGRN